MHRESTRGLSAHLYTGVCVHGLEGVCAHNINVHGGSVCTCMCLEGVCVHVCAGLE